MANQKKNGTEQNNQGFIRVRRINYNTYDIWLGNQQSGRITMPGDMQEQEDAKAMDAICEILKSRYKI